jgi:hypothetical protein
MRLFIPQEAFVGSSKKSQSTLDTAMLLRQLSSTSHLTYGKLLHPSVTGMEVQLTLSAASFVFALSSKTRALRDTLTSKGDPIEGYFTCGW